MATIDIRDGNSVLRTVRATSIGADLTAHSIREWRGVQPEPIMRFLDTNGDGTGTKNANGNYAGAEEEFLIAPPSGTTFRLYRLHWHISDAAINNTNQYGGTAAITNGCRIVVRESVGSTTLFDLTDGIPIQQNIHLARLGQIMLRETGFTGGEDFLKVVIPLDGTETSIRLDGTAGEYLAVTVNDDLTGLTGHYFFVYGYVEEDTT
jgi:hypothetical protein